MADGIVVLYVRGEIRRDDRALIAESDAEALFDAFQALCDEHGVYFTGGWSYGRVSAGETNGEPA